MIGTVLWKSDNFEFLPSIVVPAPLRRKGWHTNKKNLYTNVHKRLAPFFVKDELGGVCILPDAH